MNTEKAIPSTKKLKKIGATLMLFCPGLPCWWATVSPRAGGGAQNYCKLKQQC